MPFSDAKTKDVDHVEHGRPAVRGTDALEIAMRLEPVKKLSKRMVQLYIICGFMFLGSTMGGYDGSLMGNLLAMPSFQHQFGSSILGIETGIISSMYSIGAVCALPFVGPAVDTWGRRVGIAIGCSFIVTGTIIQGTSSHLAQFLAGRFLLGFGGTIANVACPSFVVEFAHPAYRGVVTGLYNCCYYVGAILAAVVLRGCVRYTSNASWLIPIWLQMALPAILLGACLVFPESPRWMFSHGQFEKCRACVVKFHGNDNPESLYVKLQMHEFEEELEMDGADKRWWDYRSLFNSRANLYRAILCAVALSAFSQLTGQSGVSYFLPAMLTTTGITAPDTVLDINLGISIASGLAACTGASFMDRFGRRKLLITCCATLALMWCGMLASTSEYSKTGEASAAAAAVAFIFLVGTVFSAAYTPLQALYPVEVLGFEQRAKGMALQNIAGNAAGLINQFALPVALQRIGWKTYFVFFATCSAQAVYYYFIMVETKGHTLEEMNEIFRAKNPRNASLIKKEKIEETVLMIKEGVTELADLKMG